MSLNDTPSGERLRISFFGKRNAGKSSLVNAVTNQQLAVVSDTLGTTTDPVQKAMELLPLGPVLITDTPGFDDSGKLGELRVKRTKQILNKTDIAILVTDATRQQDVTELELLRIFEEKSIPFIIAKNKSDLLGEVPVNEDGAGNVIYVSATEKTGIEELKERIGHLIPSDGNGLRLVGDIIEPGQLVVLVIPIDKAAPKGRLILPQQQAIRDILDVGAFAITTRDTELADLLEKLRASGQNPDLVITDSQAFEKVNKIVPKGIELTSFSILMARYKGFLDTAVKGARAIDELSDGDKILISEGCTHHRQCGDIGTVKLPKWLSERTGKNLVIETTSGADFPDSLEEYKLVIHCGGCMLSAREMVYRMKCAEDMNVPFTNYGIAIAYMKGILDRTIAPIYK
ncbi:MAG: [FeFe] hydrogenase H-cluster maturation GTPase HydF [Eubacterium sp.]|nr:[FeFe] hydrogenase H-cluster maturation GTPase HydF [Eubacterium sp.]